MALLITLLLLATATATTTGTTASEPSLNYTFFLSLPAQSQADSVDVTADNTRVIFNLYPKDQPEVYDPYSWHPIKDTQPYYFPDAYRLLFFLNEQATSCAIFSTKQKQIKVRTYSSTNQSAYEDRVVHSLDCGDVYNYLAVSDDGVWWAASCKGRDAFFIGKVKNGPGNASRVVIRPGSEAVEVAWRPKSHEVAVTGFVQAEKKAYLALVDAQTEEYLELPIIEHSAYRPVFSAAGRLLFMDFDSKFRQGFIKTYDISADKLQTWSLGLDANYPSTRGQFYAVNKVSEGERYVYYFDTSQDRFGAEDYYFRVRTSSGFNFGQTHDSTFLYVLSDNSTQFDVYKRCNQEGFFYDAAQNQCQQCDQSCVACLYQSTSCIGCANQSYFYQENSHTCLRCSSAIDYCYTCANSSNCLTCLERYVLNHGSCLLCENLMEGCRTCLSVDRCGDCFETYFNDGGQCTHCFQAMEGCSRCLSKDSCSECYPLYALNELGSCSLCHQLMEGCLLCSSKQLCLQCQKAYVLNSNNSCSKCSSLMEACVACSSPDRCLQCQSSYAINSMDVCSRCSELMQGCLDCQNQSQCLRCQSGYASNEVGRCSRCSQLMEGCADCLSAQSCSQCVEGYDLDPLTLRCVEGNKNFIYIVLGAVLVGCVSRGSCYNMEEKGREKGKGTERGQAKWEQSSGLGRASLGIPHSLMIYYYFIMICLIPCI